jgi:hypothetical protein
MDAVGPSETSVATPCHNPEGNSLHGATMCVNRIYVDFVNLVIFIFNIFKVSLHFYHNILINFTDKLYRPLLDW